MKYRSFRIRNYKGIDNLEIDLSKNDNDKVFTFIGLNESGKTTIFEAINSIMNPIPNKQRHTLIPKKHKANFNGTVCVGCTISVDHQDNKLIREFLRKRGYTDYKNISSFSITNNSQFKNSNYIPSLNAWAIDIKVKKLRQRAFRDLYTERKDDWLALIDYMEAELMPRILYFENFLFDFPEKIFLNAGDNTDNDKYKAVLQDIINDMYPGETIDNLIVDRLLHDTPSNKQALEILMLQMSEMLSRTVFDNWGHIFKATNASLKLYPGVDDEHVCYIEIKIQEGVSLFNISERSLGFRWFLGFLFFTLFRRNRTTDLGETLFLLDEPASNLHSTAQKKLLSTFEEFVSDKCKLLYTTHSHHLINPDWLNSAYVVKNDAVNYSDTVASYTTNTNISATLYKQFVASYPDQQDYFKPILDTLDYQPGLLEKVPNIIILEGKNDYYTLRYMNEIYFNSKYKKVNLFPGMGCTKNNNVIALYMAWNRKFVILLDADNAGKRSKVAYLKTFGDIIINNIVTYDDLVPAIGDAMMEDIFTPEEKLRITQLFDTSATTFKKSAFNSAIQNLLFTKNKIPLSDETQSKFDNLLMALNKYKF